MINDPLAPRLLTSVGDVEVFQVPEITIPTSPRWLLPGAPADELERARAALAPAFLDERGRLLQSVHTYVLRSPGRVVLIDTGVGNGKSRAGGIPVFDMLDTPFLARLAAMGVTPGDVDLVLCTHMHVDHLGWDTQRAGDGWAPTFPRARHLFVEQEYRAFMESAERDEGARLIRDDTIAPLAAAGLVDLVGPDHRVGDDLRFEPSHGHTPGHVNILLGKGDGVAVFIGDVMHSPIQVLLPSVASALNGPEQATATRIEVIRRYADTAVTVFGAHFPAPCGGLIRRVGDGYDFVPMTAG